MTRAAKNTVVTCGKARMASDKIKEIELVMLDRHRDQSPEQHSDECQQHDSTSTERAKDTQPKKKVFLFGFTASKAV